MAQKWEKILRRKLLRQIFTDSHKSFYRCVPWDVNVQDTLFKSGRKCVAMVMAYYGLKSGQILCHELLAQFVTDFYEIWHRCLPRDVCVQDTFFDSGRVCCHGNSILWAKNGRKSCAQNTSSVFHRIS